MTPHRRWPYRGPPQVPRRHRRRLSAQRRGVRASREVFGANRQARSQFLGATEEKDADLGSTRPW
eukprot:9213222-Pyramimonas_sp.AAC.1